MSCDGVFRFLVLLFRLDRTGMSGGGWRTGSLIAGDAEPDPDAPFRLQPGARGRCRHDGRRLGSAVIEQPLRKTDRAADSRKAVTAGRAEVETVVMILAGR